MLQVALWEPEIPPNVGNIARLCGATKCPLHLIGHLGFRTDDKALKRAGLDYWDQVEIHYHPSFEAFELVIDPGKLICIENPAPRAYTQATFLPGSCLLFGSESKGLPRSVVERYVEQLFDIPMFNPKIRSLNLATSVGIVLYEGLRHLNSW